MRSFLISQFYNKVKVKFLHLSYSPKLMKEELLEKQVLLEELVMKKDLMERELEISRVKSLPTVKHLNEYQVFHMFGHFGLLQPQIVNRLI